MPGYSTAVAARPLRVYAPALALVLVLALAVPSPEPAVRRRPSPSYLHTHPARLAPSTTHTIHRTPSTIDPRARRRGLPALAPRVLRARAGWAEQFGHAARRHARRLLAGGPRLPATQARQGLVPTRTAQSHAHTSLAYPRR